MLLVEVGPDTLLGVVVDQVLPQVGGNDRNQDGHHTLLGGEDHTRDSGEVDHQQLGQGSSNIWAAMVRAGLGTGSVQVVCPGDTSETVSA